MSRYDPALTRIKKIGLNLIRMSRLCLRRLWDAAEQFHFAATAQNLNGWYSSSLAGNRYRL